MTPKGNKLIYEVRASLIGRYGLIRLFLCIVLCWLVIPLLYLIYMIAVTSASKRYIYEDRIVHVSGILHKHQSVTLLTIVFGANINQTLKGRIFNFGNVNVKVLGAGAHNNLGLWEIKDPVYVKSIFDKMTLEDKKRNPNFTPPPVTYDYY